MVFFLATDLDLSIFRSRVSSTDFVFPVVELDVRSALGALSLCDLIIFSVLNLYHYNKQHALTLLLDTVEIDWHRFIGPLSVNEPESLRPIT